jgi:hypothetical protein
MTSTETDLYVTNFTTGKKIRIERCICGKDVRNSYDGHYHKYLCSDCGIETKMHNHIEDAVKEWNKLLYKLVGAEI